MQVVLVEGTLVMKRVQVQVLIMLVGLLVLLMPLLVVRAEVAVPVERCDAQEGSCYLENAYRRWNDRILCKVRNCPLHFFFLVDVALTLFGNI